MACSEARLAANRANAQHSTGPRTDAGKETSRRNALKHGLTGAGVVIPGEDAAELARRSGVLKAELAVAGSEAALILAERVAVHSVRLGRCVRHEFAATAERVRRAGEDFDAARRAEAARRFEERAPDLLDMPEGVDLVLEQLRGLGAATPAAEMARLEAHRATLDHDAIAAGRAEATHLALVATDRDALLAQRYEAATERAMFRALKEIQVLRRAQAAPEPDDDLAAASRATAAARADLARCQVAACSPLGSSGAEPIAPPRPTDASTITIARPADRPKSRYEDRKRRPKFPR